MIKIRLFIKKFFAGILGVLVIVLFLNSIKLNVLKPFEKLEVIIGITGLFTTFLGAYIGAKIAGNESRNLFKQEIKMNDLSKSMDINLEVLERIEEVKIKLDKMKDLNKSNFLDPSVIVLLKDESEQISGILNSIKRGKLISTSVILYSDIQKLCEEFSNVKREIDYIINIDETRKILRNIKIQNESISVINYWDRYIVRDERVILIDVIDSEGKEILEEISVDLIIKNNRTFFEEKRKKVNNLIFNTNIVFNEMEYKNRKDLIEEYTKLYRN